MECGTPRSVCPKYPPQAMVQVRMDKRWIEEQKEKMRQMLESRGTPEGVWEYYIEAPKDWAGDDVDEKGVHNGVRNILMSQRSIKPWWVQNSSLKMMAELKLKFTRVVQAIEEVDRFTRQKMPEDNQLNSECKLAQKQAESCKMPATSWKQPSSPQMSRLDMNFTIIYLNSWKKPKTITKPEIESKK